MSTSTQSRLAHRTSHAGLLQATGPLYSGRRSSRGRLDAIIVPAARPASALTGLIALSAALNCAIVVLCSRQANVAQVMKRIERVPEARGLAVTVDDDYELPGADLTTMSRRFAGVSSHRSSDLSLKRNFGLLLARRMGWNKVVFVDDDIIVSAHAISRLSRLLDDNPVAGMMCRDFPDNSVVCHARRLAGFDQDVFVSGAVLGVHTGDYPVPLFPDVYNEDWFFFSAYAAGRTLAKAGEAIQAPYNPFGEQSRAAQEEFGDLIAEGLYTLFATQGPREKMRSILRRAGERYWSDFIATRREFIAETRAELVAFGEGAHAGVDIADALRSLDTADSRYTDVDDLITTARCCEFVEDWQRDTETWARTCHATNSLRTTGEALASLNAVEWQAHRRLKRPA